MTQTSINRNELVAIAIESTAFIRDFCRRDGVSGLGDFLNGMLSAGLALEHRIEGSGSFEELLHDEIASARDTRSTDAFQRAAGALAGSVLAEVVAEKSSLSLIATVACEGKFVEVTKERGLDKAAMLRMIAVGAVAVICDASDDEDLDEHLRVLSWSVEEKSEAAKMVSGLSDRDLFGDF